MDRRSTVMWASSLNIIAGIWLIIAPFILLFDKQAGRVDDVIVGIVVAVLAAIRVFAARDAVWLSWINAILGLWTIASPFVLGLQAQSAYWNNVIVGIVILVLGIISASAVPAMTRAPHTAPHTM
jgi:hypothetical protein